MNESTTDRHPLTAGGSEEYGRLVRLASYASVSVALLLIGTKTWAFRITDSVSLLSSLADSLLDLLASLITLFAIRYALEPADREHRFGHGKSEGVAGLAQAFIVSGSALYVAFEAVQRLLNPVAIAEPTFGMAVMLLSIVATLCLVLFQRFVTQRTGSLAVSADAAHYKADLATNLAVLLALGADRFFGWALVDALVGLLVVTLIFVSVYHIWAQSLDVLLDRELSEAERRKVKRIATSHPAVMGMHDLRTRSTGSAQFIQFHLELDPKLSLLEAHDISDEVEQMVEAGFPAAEVIIHADPFGVHERRDFF
jgi:ferrous-iron efflux pump FieF